MNSGNKITKFDMFVMLFLVGVIPFLVYSVGYYTPITILYPEKTYIYDFFALIKVRAIMLTAFCVLGNFLLEISTSYSKVMSKEKIDELKSKKFMFLWIILLSTIIAFILSDHKDIALWGAVERFEGIFIHFSYIILFIYSISFFRKDGAFKFFSYCLLFSTFIVGLIALLQTIGMSPFEVPAIQQLLTPDDIKMTLVMDSSFSTMYNPNTAGSYSVFMMFAVAVIFILDKDVKVRVVAIIDFILMILMMIFNQSEASYIAFVAAIAFGTLLYIILFAINKEKKKLITLVSVVVFVLVSSIVVVTTNDRVNSLVKNTFERFVGYVAVFTDWEQVEDEFYFYNEDDEFIKVSITDSGYIVSEGDTQLFADAYNEGSVTLETENFETITVGVQINPSDNIPYVNFNNYFFIKGTPDSYLATLEGYARFEHADFIGFEKYGSLFTNRGYIWSRSLPILIENPMGVGPDVYSEYFPNADVAGRAFNQQPFVFVDKPHNLYLDMSINNGILYLVGFIGVVFLVLFEKFKLVFKNTDGVYNKNALIIYICGIFAYLVNILSTDNIVIIILLFWIYLAIDDKIFLKNDSDSISKESN